MDKKSNKKRLYFLIFAEILLISCLVLLLVFGLKLPRIKNIGNPLAIDFKDELYLSRTSADLTVFDGKLFIGGGDYDKNTGPVYVHSYDVSSGEWKKSAEPLPDEQIKRFVIIDKELYATGTDPKDDWEKGNFYRYENGEFVTYRVLDGAIHNFDIVKFEDKLFFALGVAENTSPVIVFENEEYSPVPFLKDGAPLDTTGFETVRVYNFLVFDGKLYAFLSLGDEKEALMDLYVYENGAFSHLFGSLPSVDMTETLELGGMAFLLMGYNLFSTEDLVSFESVPLGAPVLDVYPYGNGFFALCSAKKGESSTSETKLNDFEANSTTHSGNLYKNTIFFTTDGKTFDEVVSFETAEIASSLAFDGSVFFTSLGGYDSSFSENVGTILLIKP